MGLGMKRLARSALVAAFVMMIGAGGAQALTPYVAPADFTPEDGPVAVSAAFASQFFTPSVGLEPGGFQAIGPDGAPIPYSSVRVEQNAAQMEFPVYSNGTYRITSGAILGPVAQMVGVDGAWRALQAGEIPPEGAPLSTLQTVTLADAYVTRGRPNEGALSGPSTGLVIQPVTHPNRISVAEGLSLQLNFNGAPFPNMPFVLYAANDPETKLDTTFVTGADGRALIRFPSAGRYLIAIRHRGEAPAGSAAQVLSYTTTLTVEAYDVLPALPAAEEPRDRRRSRPQRDTRSRL